jgi:hypothetical protein
MTDYLGKLMLYDAYGSRQLFYMQSVCRDRYRCVIYAPNQSRRIDEYSKEAITASIFVGALRPIEEGDKLYSPIGTSFYRVDRWFGDRMACSGVDCYARLELSYNDFLSLNFRFAFEGTVKEKPINNKGRKTCFSCNCKTEQRRDFSDMSIREMCPRCKI